MKLCVTKPDFLEKNFLPPKLRKGQKQGLLKILKIFVINFYWICSVVNMYIICYVPAQVPYLGKISWDMGQNVLSQSDCRIFLSTISPEQINEIAWFLHVDTNSHKLIVDQKISGLAWPELGVDGKNELMELTNFLHGGANSGKLKVISMILGWAWSKIGMVI